jgi:hypothetical protein
MTQDRGVFRVIPRDSDGDLASEPLIWALLTSFLDLFWPFLGPFGHFPGYPSPPSGPSRSRCLTKGSLLAKMTICRIPRSNARKSCEIVSNFGLFTSESPGLWPTSIWPKMTLFGGSFGPFYP